VLTSVMLAMLLAWGTAASAAPGWTVVPTVDPSATKNVLNAVAVRTSGDAWAVGHLTAPDQDDDGLNMLTERWNGTSWSVVASPNVGGNDNLLNGVSAITGDVWSVGSSNVTARTLALRETG
jgi:hypothetical protein